MSQATLSDGARLGRVIKAFREQNPDEAMTQDRFASLAELSRNTVINLEAERTSMIRTRQLNRIAAAMRLTVGELRRRMELAHSEPKLLRAMQEPAAFDFATFRNVAESLRLSIGEATKAATAYVASLPESDMLSAMRRGRTLVDGLPAEIETAATDRRVTVTRR